MPLLQWRRTHELRRGPGGRRVRRGPPLLQIALLPAGQRGGAARSMPNAATNSASASECSRCAASTPGGSAARAGAARACIRRRPLHAVATGAGRRGRRDARRERRRRAAAAAGRRGPAGLRWQRRRRAGASPRPVARARGPAAARPRRLRRRAARDAARRGVSAFEHVAQTGRALGPSRAGAGISRAEAPPPPPPKVRGGSGGGAAAVAGALAARRRRRSAATAEAAGARHRDRRVRPLRRPRGSRR